jgi:hypothetical protein
MKRRWMLLQNDSVVSNTMGSQLRVKNTAAYGYQFTPTEYSKLTTLLAAYKNNGGVADLLYDASLSVNYNRLYNTEFSQNSTGWNPYVNGGTGTNPLVTAVGGELQVVTQGTYSFSGVVQNGVPIEANKNYILSGTARGSLASWSLAYYLGSANNPNGAVILGNTNQTFSFNILSTSTGNIDLYLRTNTVGPLTFWLDNLQLTDADSGQVISLNQRNRTDNTPVKVLNLGSAGANGDGTFVNGNAGSMNVRELNVTTSVNLIPNSSLEAGLIKTTNNGLPTAELDNTNARSGSNCLKLVNNGTGFPGIALFNVKIQPNTQYTFSCYYKNPVGHVTGTNGNGFRPYYVTKDNGSGTIGQAGTLTDLTVANGTYTRASTTFTTEPGANWVELSVYMYSNGTAYFDDFQLELGAVATAYVSNQPSSDQRAISYQNGSSQYITTTYEHKPNLTALFVVKRTKSGKMSMIGSTGGNSCISAGFNFNATLFMDKAYVINIGSTSGSYASVNDYHVIGFSFNNTTLQYKFYADGVLVGSGTASQSIVTAGKNVLFGSTLGGEEFFDGNFLHSSYSSQVLTDAQVASISAQLKSFYKI